MDKIISFVIPAYNSEKHLHKCLNSFLNTSVLERIEVVVVNDGSADKTPDIAKEYVEKYPHIFCLHNQKNAGHGGAINSGAKLARGKYLKVIDADDWVETDNLPKYIELLEGCESDVVLTHYHTINISNGEIKNWRSYPQTFGKDYSFGAIMTQWNNFERCLTFHGITYRTEFYQEHSAPLLEHVFYEDHEYTTFPCCCAQSVVCFDLFIYEYRIGDVNQSVSNSNQLKRIGHTEAVIHRMIDKYKILSEHDGKRYAAMKVQVLLMSYLNIALLLNPDRREGRQQAESIMIDCRAEAPEVYNIAKKKYRVFYLMNRLHIKKATWEKILSSKLYKWVRKKHTFE